MKALINARVLKPEGFKDNQSVLFHNGIISAVCDDNARTSDINVLQDLGGMTLLPGFIDTQVNGGGGVLFNDNPSVDAIKTIGEAHRKFGTTGFFPTLISADMDVMAQAIQAVEDAIAKGVPGVLGIHLEGPFLNPVRRGVHDSAKFVEIRNDVLHLLGSLKGGKTILTLAPEMTTSGFIQRLSARGIIVAAGHTNANFQQARSAMDAGLRGFTHLFNAMSQMASRDPGIIAAALEDKRAWSGIIVDGHHVHPAMLRLALRAQMNGQIFLVTDAMPSVGAPGKDFTLGDVKIAVRNGKCITPDDRLAGSDLDMMRAVRNAVRMLDIDLAQAVRMASQLPARFVGLQNKAGEIRPGLQADFVLMNSDHRVVKTWIKGKAVPGSG